MSKQDKRKKQKVLAEKRRMDGVKAERVMDALAGRPPKEKYRGWRGNRHRSQITIIDEVADIPSGIDMYFGGDLIGMEQLRRTINAG